MTLLDRCQGGSTLEKPRAKEVALDLDAAEQLKQRIPLIACLLSVNSWRMKRIGSWAIWGFWQWKIVCVVRQGLMLGMANPGTTAMVAEPSFPMIRTVFIPAMDDALARWEIDYEFRVSPQPEYLIKLPTGPIKILCQSAENWQRVRGQNISFVLWDEADTSPVDTAQKAGGEMFLARMRVGKVNQLALASTPEGFRYCYRQFEEQKGPDKHLIRVKTMDNPHLPEGFVESLRRNYPPQLIQAYLDGHFVNLASCSLYPDFDRSQHYTDAMPTESDTIFVGIDINVGNSVTQHCIRRGDAFHFFNEAVYRDTQQIAEGLKELYPWHFANDQLILIPDAAAKQGVNGSGAGVGPGDIEESGPSGG